LHRWSEIDSHTLNFTQHVFMTRTFFTLVSTCLRAK